MKKMKKLLAVLIAFVLVVTSQIGIIKVVKADEVSGCTYSYIDAHESNITSIMNDYLVADNGLENYARRTNVVASASSQSDDAHSAQQVVNYQSTERWQSSSAQNEPQWVAIDLGQKLDINTLKLVWEATQAVEFEIQISETGEKDSYTTIATLNVEKRSNFRVDTIVLNNSYSTQYIRIYMIKNNNNTSNDYKLYKVGIYGGSEEDSTPEETNQTTSVVVDNPTTQEENSSENESSATSRYIVWDVADSYLAGWTYSKATMTADGNNATVNIETTGWSEGNDNTMWALQAKSTKMKVTPGETYKYTTTLVSYMDKEVYVKISSTDGYDTEIGGKRVVLKANEPQTIVIENLKPTVNEVQVVYALGTMGTEAEKKNFSIEFTNSILEGKVPEGATSEATTPDSTTQGGNDSENGATANSRNIVWDVDNSYLAGWTYSKATMTADGNNATINIETTGWSEGNDNTMWALQAKSTRMNVIPGETYRYTTTLESSTDKEIYIKISSTDGSNTEIGGKRVALKANEPQRVAIDNIKPGVDEVEIVYALGTMGTEAEKKNFTLKISNSVLEGKNPDIVVDEPTTPEATIPESTTPVPTTPKVDDQTTSDKDHTTTANINNTTTVTPTTQASTTVAPTETTVDPRLMNKPGKVKVKKATKKYEAKKAKISIKKVKGATGYEMAVYASKKNAKKDNKVIVRAEVAKVKAILKDKKLKNKKKLFVRVRAFVDVNKTKVYGKWSKVKKVKIK